jgi:hypothetical protein
MMACFDVCIAGRTSHWGGSSRRVRGSLILWPSIIGKKAHVIGTRGGLDERELLVLIRTDLTSPGPLSPL